MTLKKKLFVSNICQDDFSIIFYGIKLPNLNFLCIFFLFFFLGGGGEG